MKKALMFTASKGGIGTSSLASACALELSRNGDTLLIEIGKLNFSCDLYLGMQDNMLYTLDDYAENSCELFDSISDNGKRLWLGLAKNSKNALMLIKKLIENGSVFDYLILDVNISSDVDKELLDIVDICFLLTSQEIESVRSCEAYISHLRQAGANNIELVVNKHRYKNTEYLYSAESIAMYLDLYVRNVIDFDKKYIYGLSLLGEKNGKLMTGAKKICDSFREEE